MMIFVLTFGIVLIALLVILGIGSLLGVEFYSCILIVNTISVLVSAFYSQFVKFR